MAEKRSAKSGQSSTKRRLVTAPETVYKVVSKPSKRIAPKHIVRKNRPTLYSRLHGRFQTRWLVYILIPLVLLSVFGLYRIHIYTNITILNANQSSENAMFDSDTLQRLRLIGQERDYPTEITNYQSTPADLRSFIISDYKQLKTNCIVNGAFADTPSYTVVNIVYDSFARVEKSCNGADTLILKKMSGVWTIIYAGNDLPKCSDVNAFDIPQGISYKCREGFVTYTNPNP